MKSIYIKIILFCVVMVLPSCQLDDIPNPNAPTIDIFDQGASRNEIQLLAIGVEAVMRNDLAFHYDAVSILGREYYDLTGIDPRLTGEILIGDLDDNGFLTTRAYAAWYKIVQSANVLINAVENSNAELSNEAISSYIGYAKTLKAYALSMVANRQFTNGIRIDVADPDNLGPNVGYDEALTAIMDLLNEADADLANAGDISFDFDISDGFEGFNTPSLFRQFNRALAARVALYQNNKMLALSLLDESFLDLGGNLYTGVAHVFGGTGNDILNAQFHILEGSGTNDAFMVHPTWIADAESGDTRVTNKSQLFEPGTRTFDGLTADYQIAVYKSNTDSVYLIRNEELILIYAEVNIGANNVEAVNAINIIRNAAGLPNYSGGTSDSELLDEVLNQRRYSLFVEGHRWIDLRRLNRLDETNIPLDRPGDNIVEAFPTPFSEGL